MKAIQTKKRGITLVELIVAMAVFSIVMTMAVGAFVTVSRMMKLTDSMKNTQQKLRVAIEMVSRLARQAPVVLVANNPADGSISSTVEMYFALDAATGVPQYASRFEIKDSGSGRSLYYSECKEGKIAVATKKCSEWQVSSDLLSGPLRLEPTSSFSKSGKIPPVLRATLKGSVPGATGNNQYYADTLNIVTDIVLEQIR